jgi:antitoxin FitA
MMTEIIIQDVDLNALRKLEALAKLHGRSLQAEIKYILETAAQSQSTLPTESIEAIRQKAVQMQRQLENYAGEATLSEATLVNDSTNFSSRIEQLRTLKKTVSSLQDLSIRDAIEAGRRF